MYTPVDQRDAISITAAQNLLHDYAANHLTESELVDATTALHRTLAEPVVAPHALPLFPRSGYDGYAVRQSDLTALPVTLNVVGNVPAGAHYEATLNPGEAVRIMTGGSVPAGADCVVMLETTTTDGQTVTISARQKGDNITPIGAFYHAGDVLLEAGTTLNPGGIGLLASFAITHVTVAKRIKVAVIATGSELVAADTELTPGKIHNSNGPMIAGLCEGTGAVVVSEVTVPDNPEQLKAAIAKAQATADVVITDGGVSVGDCDFIADFAKASDQLLFNKLEMRPGSVTTAYVHQDVLFFGLSGNPGACFTGWWLFVEPTLRTMMHAQSQMVVTTGTLDQLYKKTNMYDRILRGVATIDATGLHLARVGGDSSDNLNNLQQATCLFEIPRGDSATPAGAQLKTWLLPCR